MIQRKRKWDKLLKRFQEVGHLWGHELLFPLEHALRFAKEVNNLGLHVTAIDSWFTVPTPDYHFAVAPALESFANAGHFGRRYLTLDDIELIFREQLSRRVSYVSFHLDIPDDWY